ncbi:MAG: 4'-phosphopantetheinyl transferase superfamily protein [Actinomycetota bacterium]|nr:4'-phosphopantetheinyl transferase superfamily protein [Actinomycetota bacterium]
MAVRCDEDVRGVGVDFEPWRPEADLRVARFFLRPTELAAVTGAAPLMRLWTIKEALYKATPDNGPCVLLDFALADPGGACGHAVGPRGEALRYAAIDVAGGHLAVAVCALGRRHGPV